ncbi:MAG TPA: TatD family hydrolase [Myxococcota bacterium]|nr:TatD family hydrolase [Myxococcota bacterium]
MWIDSHCHLAADEFAGDRGDVLARARAAKVAAFVVVGSGYGIAGNARAAELAAREPDCFATVGVHPHEAQEFDDAGRALLDSLLGNARVVGVGETGLDYHYMKSPRDVQRAVFAEQLALARSRRLPVSIHVRGDEPNAFEELLDIWRAEGRGELQGVLHCYTGTLDFALRALRENLYVSFSGILTFKKDRGLREVAAGLPLERLLVETDAPLLAPEGQRGRRNEPAHVEKVGRALAEAQGRAVEDVALSTARNARALFGIGGDA